MIGNFRRSTDGQTSSNYRKLGLNNWLRALEQIVNIKAHLDRKQLDRKIDSQYKRNFGKKIARQKDKWTIQKDISIENSQIERQIFNIKGHFGIK